MEYYILWDSINNNDEEVGEEDEECGIYRRDRSSRDNQLNSQHDTDGALNCVYKKYKL